MIRCWRVPVGIGVGVAPGLGDPLGDGEGEGKMSLATKITEDKDKHIITLENYDIQPVLLQSVRRERASQ